MSTVSSPGKWAARDHAQAQSHWEARRSLVTHCARGITLARAARRGIDLRARHRLSKGYGKCRPISRTGWATELLGMEIVRQRLKGGIHSGGRRL